MPIPIRICIHVYVYVYAYIDLHTRVHISSSLHEPAAKRTMAMGTPASSFSRKGLWEQMHKRPAKKGYGGFCTSGLPNRGVETSAQPDGEGCGGLYIERPARKGCRGICTKLGEEGGRCSRCLVYCAV